MPTNSFAKNVVFGSTPIGDSSDISINLIEHIHWAEIILVESHRQFSRLITEANQLDSWTVVEIAPEATIYQYQLESGEDKALAINEEILNFARNGKKILVVSDEGSSLFLEPMNLLKSLLVENNIEYKILPGPNSVISAVVSGKQHVNDFCFGGNYQWINPKRKEIMFKIINEFKIPVVFILTAKGTPSYMQEILENINVPCTIDFAMNLTMVDELHIEKENKQEILDFIDSNKNLWYKDDEKKKVIVTIHPRELLEK